MKHLRYFKENNSYSFLDKISDDFWEMVGIVNWDSFIKNKNKSNWKQNYAEVQASLFRNFNIDEINSFGEEYRSLLYHLSDFFESYWLDDPGYGVSDDGYSDLISSIIGKGKDFIKKCMEDPTIPAKMVNNDDYAENFGYLFNLDKEDLDKHHDIYYDLN